MKNQSKRFARLFSQYLPSAMVFRCGLALLIICTVAAFVIAYYHDAYSSILEMKELAATDVWFKLFVILMVLGAALLVGSPLLAMILAGITMLLPGRRPESVEGQPTEVSAVVKEEPSSVKEKAPATEQPERVIINEARLRTIFNSDFITSVTQVEVVPGLFVITHSNNRMKKDYLEQISTALNLGWKVELIK